MLNLPIQNDQNQFEKLEDKGNFNRNQRKTRVTQEEGRGCFQLIPQEQKWSGSQEELSRELQERREMGCVSAKFKPQHDSADGPAMGMGQSLPYQ